MATPQNPKFKAPETPPMKPPADMLDATKPQGAAIEPIPPKAEQPASVWKPISTAPQDRDAKFMVRATTLNNDGQRVPVGGTETLVRYRPSRVRQGRHWVPSLTIIEDRHGTKLGFRPNEWREATAANG